VAQVRSTRENSEKNYGKMPGEEVWGLWVALATAPGIERVAEYLYTPAAALWFFVNAFTYARLPSDQPHEGAPGWI